MIVLEPGGRETREIEDLVNFAAQLDRAGVDIAISSEIVTEQTPQLLKYAALPYLRDLAEQTVSALLVLGVNRAGEDGLAAIRRMRLADGAKVILFGRFDTRQDEIAATMKYAYVTGGEPVLINLGDLEGIDTGSGTCPCFGVPVASRADGDVRLPVAVLAPRLGQADALPGFQMLATSRSLRPVFATSGKQKTQWNAVMAPGHAVLQFNEISPVTFAAQARVLVVTGDPVRNAWAQSVVNNALVSGHVIVDCTLEQHLANAHQNVLAGPAHSAHLATYLRDVVRPNLEGLLAEAAAVSHDAIDLGGFVRSLGIETGTAAAEEPASHRIWIMPTNGVGLGHAQRSALIAAELGERVADVRFAAFSSCLPMLAQYGFDAMPLVQRTGLHGDNFAHDLINYARMRAALAPGDTFVFDGGYIFDSVFKTILTKQLRAIWLRRGLWQNQPSARIALDREAVFSRVIVPREGFEALNAPLSAGDRVFEVGPVVQRFDAPGLRDAVRKKLAAAFGREFETLSVTMMGGGVAADLSAHVQAAAAEFERRAGHLNLIVMWPGAVVRPVWYGWANSRVVTTRHAGLLAHAADFIISATGYNTFHEALYNRIPAIFVPQMSEFMDDQAARAEAAAAAGAALHVAQDKPGQLPRAISRLLDGGKLDDLRGALARLDLAEPGNGDAARLIAEVADG